MEKSAWYWLILFLVAVSYFGGNWGDGPNYRYARIGSGVFIVILFIIIGFMIAGSPIK